MMGTLAINDRIAAELRSAIAYRSESGASVARALGVDPLWVTRRLSGTTAISVEDLFCICHAIGAVPLDVVASAMVGPTAPIRQSAVKEGLTCEA
jgi:hypothetical protein